MASGYNESRFPQGRLDGGHKEDPQQQAQGHMACPNDIEEVPPPLLTTPSLVRPCSITYHPILSASNPTTEAFALRAGPNAQSIRMDVALGEWFGAGCQSECSVLTVQIDPTLEFLA